MITCDSIKNWLSADQFFNAESKKLYEEQGFFGPATISNVWIEACKVSASDFVKLRSLSFLHLLSAHDEPLLNDAYPRVLKSIQQKFEF